MPSSPTKPTRSPVTKAGAGTAVGWMSVAAVITILVTRGYLLATGYPQVGGEIFHIAHAVWGGLLLMIALTVVLSLANRWATAFASIAGGIGIGLFVDEIGKFITKDNDYFFPLAAPLCYAILAALGVAAMRVGSQRPPHARNHLYAALELMKPAADGPLTRSQVETIEGHLDAVMRDEPTGQERAIAEGLAQALDVARSQAVPDEERRVGRIMERLDAVEERLLPPSRQRKLSRLALGVLAVVGVFAGPGVFVYSLWQAYGPDAVSGHNSLLGDHPGKVAWTAASVAALIGTVAAFFAWRAVKRLGDDSSSLADGARWGIAALLLMLGGVNLLNAYFNQFLVFINACFEAGVVGLLARVKSRADKAAKTLGHDHS
ncbi:hypothetical protein [Dermacoccus nishinomiyaensis]|uniref:hypothetical protein n=1 Tax=Dermacoccus nishinomiyaensis TaxID=1274 RepID=UPI0011A6CCC3|nr:hypothetical protein [Dermacoccus nishinomiyaensis]